MQQPVQLVVPAGGHHAPGTGVGKRQGVDQGGVGLVGVRRAGGGGRRSVAAKTTGVAVNVGGPVARLGRGRLARTN